MLARFKCNEIKNSSLALVEDKIQSFINESINKEINTNEFVSSVKGIVNQAVGMIFFHKKDDKKNLKINIFIIY